MKFIGKVCIGILMFGAQTAHTSFSPENTSESRELNNLAQHLWDEEWSSPSSSEVEAPLDEAILFDTPDMSESETVAGRWWGTSLNQEALLSQHLWDEEWSSSEVSEDAPQNEVILFDTPDMSESETVAGNWWDTSIEPTNLLSQHLWDEEWSSSEVSEDAPQNEAILFDTPDMSESETVAGNWWDTSIEPTNMLSQHLWDEEWSSPSSSEVEAPLDEAILFDTPDMSESETVAGRWWGTSLNQEALLSQHLWDEEWSSSEVSEDAPQNEVILFDTPDMSESETVAGNWWDTSIEPTNLLSQHLWDEEWSSSEVSEDEPQNEAILFDTPDMSESETVASYWWDKSFSEQSELLSQHLWDEEWSNPVQTEEVAIDEALLLDTPAMDESELVAGTFWNDLLPEHAIS